MARELLLLLERQEGRATRVPLLDQRVRPTLVPAVDPVDHDLGGHVYFGCSLVRALPFVQLQDRQVPDGKARVFRGAVQCFEIRVGQEILIYFQPFHEGVISGYHS